MWACVISHIQFTPHWQKWTQLVSYRQIGSGCVLTGLTWPLVVLWISFDESWIPLDLAKWKIFNKNQKMESRLLFANDYHYCGWGPVPIGCGIVLWGYLPLTQSWAYWRYSTIYNFWNCPLPGISFSVPSFHHIDMFERPRINQWNNLIINWLLGTSAGTTSGMKFKHDTPFCWSLKSNETEFCWFSKWRREIAETRTRPTAASGTWHILGEPLTRSSKSVDVHVHI